jgi:hypothetical protein
MKKLFSAMLLIVNLSCFAQANKWFVSLCATPTIGGPSASIKKQMVDQHFDQTSSFSFFFIFSGETKYPVVAKDGSLLIRAGKKISDRRSIYLVAGQTAAGKVEGFQNQGYSDLLIIASSVGQHIEVNYHAYQITGGYLYSFPDTRAKLGFGPSIFMLNYSLSENYNGKETHTGIVPGATCTVRMPLGKEKKLIGLELIFEGNVAPSIKMKGNMKETGFKPGTANMLSANAGLALTFRR